MSDYTESDYTKTGKKVKSIGIDRVDLTYNKVYDVFIDSDGYEFIIDDVGHKRYVFVDNRNYYELVDDVAEANNTTDDIHNTNETKLKFKDGDKVMVVNTDYISAYDAGVRVGDIGTVIESGVNKYHVKFEGTGYDCDWWFTDECIDLVRDDDNTIENENTPIKSDGTKGFYTKTGKKVMCINGNRRDLTYKKVYDVFTNQDSAEFIIDDVGDKRYESLEFPYWCEKSDGMVDKANETKPKFKVGDTVRVTSTDYIRQYDASIKVGDVGVITHIWYDPDIPYQVFDWYFPEGDLELVVGDNSNTPIKSDGGSSSYYAQQIPKGMLERFNTTNTIEAKDVIRLFLGNDFNMGNIFKAYCRIISLRNGKGKEGIDEQYDLTKAKYFTEDELNYYLENNNV